MKALPLALLLLAVEARAQSIPPGWTDCSPGTACFEARPAPLQRVLRIVKPLVYAVDDKGEAQLTVVRFPTRSDVMDEAALREHLKGMERKGVRIVERGVMEVGKRRVARIVTDVDKKGARVRQIAYLLPEFERGVALNFEIAPAAWERLRAVCDATARAWATRSR